MNDYIQAKENKDKDTLDQKFVKATTRQPWCFC